MKMCHLYVCVMFLTSFRNVFKLEEILFVYYRISTGTVFHKPINRNMPKVSAIKISEQFIAYVYLGRCQTSTTEPIFKSLTATNC